MNNKITKGKYYVKEKIPSFVFDEERVGEFYLAKGNILHILEVDDFIVRTNLGGIAIEVSKVLMAKNYLEKIGYNKRRLEAKRLPK